MKNSMSWLTITLSSVGIISALVFSSCSNENGIEPVIEVKQPDRDETSAKLGLFHITPTNSQPGISAAPNGWNGLKHENSIFAVSTVEKLGGIPLLLWQKQLPQPAPGVNTFLTTSTSTGPNGYPSEYSYLITNLVAGKKYNITFRVSTSAQQNGEYAKTALFAVKSFNLGDPYTPSAKSKVIDLANKPCEWITETLTFTAGSADNRILFWNSSPSSSQTFTNLHIGPGAIKEVNER